MNIISVVSISACIISCTSVEYSSPLRDWQTGFWEGNPLYSPLGRFQNYSMIFRPNDGPYKNYLIVETGIQFSAAQGSYQQWTIKDNQLTYCGLLTMDNGQSYMITIPQFIYYPDISSQYEVYFCADPHAGGCDQFKWLWKYNNETNQFRSVNEVGGIPHQDTFFNLQINIDAAKAPVQKLHRQMCTYLLGVEEPYDYGWIQQPNITDNGELQFPKVEKLTNKNRQRLRDSIPNYGKYYEMKKK
eukprot:936466_1